MMRSLLSASLLASLLACSAQKPEAQRRLAAATRPPAPAAQVAGLSNIQRTMRLLSTSTKAQRNTVRILFYGQSITESAWSRRLEQKLRARFPDADLQVENRALGGFAAQLLIKSAETDLYPYYPDLVIFHVFGAHDRYEEIMRRIRARTTAEILHQTDHIVDEAELSEVQDPAQLAPKPEVWSAFMNHAFLPSMVARYQTALCDQRSAWKQYLAAARLKIGTLLSDGVHLNAAGDVLMSDLVDSCLKVSSEPSPAEAWVTTYEVGKDLQFERDTLALTFEGNRVDVLTAADAHATDRVSVRIDGRPPSAWPELYAFTRAQAAPCGKWPPLFDLGADAPRLLEDWTLHLRALDGGVYAFEARGTKTGPDGAGRTDQRFVSRSGRLVIEPDDWNVAYALELGGTKEAPAALDIHFRVDPHFTDGFAGAPHDPAVERAITVAAGLTSGRHTLTLTSTGGTSPVIAVRVYRPPLSSPSE